MNFAGEYEDGMARWRTGVRDRYQGKKENAIEWGAFWGKVFLVSAVVMAICAWALIDQTSFLLYGLQAIIVVATVGSFSGLLFSLGGVQIAKSDQVFAEEMIQQHQ